MITKTCMPVLIETKDINTAIKINRNNKFYNLILFSCDLNETFTTGDLITDGIVIIAATEKLVNAQDLIGRRDWRKIIATQKELSPEYIQRFIQEHDSSRVNNIEIEMEQEKSTGYTEDRCRTFYGKYKPVLTNGYVTIVEKNDKKELVHFPFQVDKDHITLYGAGKFAEEKLVLDRTKASLLFVELWKFLDFDKSNKPNPNDPIIYTEDEVWDITYRAVDRYIDWMTQALNGNYNARPDLLDWFNQNKKKV